MYKSIVLLTVLTILVVSPVSKAVLFNDGQPHTIDYTINEPVGVQVVGTHITLVDGGYITGDLDCRNGGQVTILGGRVAGMVAQVSLMPMTISGGIIDEYIAMDAPTAEGDLIIIGSDFKVNGIDVPYGIYTGVSYGHIFGTLLNGDVLDVDFHDSGPSDIIFMPVPEPATLILLGLGGLLIRRKK